MRRSRSRRTQRRARRPAAPSKIVVRATVAVAASCGADGLGHDVAGLGIGPRPLEDDPAVEPGEVVGVGQPDVDDGEAAGARWSASVCERGALGVAASRGAAAS